MAWPRSFSRRAVSASDRAPAAHRAEYSPSEWPAEGGARHVDVELDLQHPYRGQGHGHQGGLGVLGQGQLVLGPLAHQQGQLLAQGVVDLGIDLAGGGEGVGQGRAHADRLAALSGKQEGEGHARSLRS